MRRLKITNMMSASEWEPYRRRPRALVRQERYLSPCDTCGGDCCGQKVDLTAVEAVRIALTLVLPLPSFIETRPFEEQTNVDMAASHAVLLEEGPVRLYLRRREGVGCTFLQRIDGRGRCLAYSVRPGICRVYPYAVEEEDGTTLAVGTFRWCPSGWLYDESTERAVAASIAAWREDLALDEELCARWNEGEQPERTLAAFARFAAHELALRLGLDAERLYPPERRAFDSRLKAYSG